MAGAAVVLEIAAAGGLVMPVTAVVVASVVMRFVDRRRMVVHIHSGCRFPAESRREDGGQQNQQDNAGDATERVHEFHYNERNGQLKTTLIKNAVVRAARSTSLPYFLIGWLRPEKSSLRRNTASLTSPFGLRAQ